MNDLNYNLACAIQNWSAAQLSDKKINALTETALLKDIENVLKDYQSALKPDAIALAKEQLALAQRTSGDFVYEGHRFSLSQKDIYDMAGKPQRYTMPEGVQYRDFAKQKADLAKRSSAMTKFMDALVKTFAAQHPDFKPDDTQFVLKVME